LFVTVANGVASIDLTPASRRQDHTTSPSANAFRKSRSAVLVPSRRSFCEGGSAALVLRRRRVHRIPCQRPWRSRNAPQVGRDGGKYECDLGQARREIFLQEGLDG